MSGALVRPRARAGGVGVDAGPDQGRMCPVISGSPRLTVSSRRAHRDPGIPAPPSLDPTIVFIIIRDGKVHVQGQLDADGSFGSCDETMALAARPQRQNKGFPLLLSKITNKSRWRMRPGTRRTTWKGARADTVAR